MSSGRRVIPFRPKPGSPTTVAVSCRINGDVSVCKLVLGLKSVGLVFKHDTRTRQLVIAVEPS